MSTSSALVPPEEEECCFVSQQGHVSAALFVNLWSCGDVTNFRKELTDYHCVTFAGADRNQPASPCRL